MHFPLNIKYPKYYHREEFLRILQKHKDSKFDLCVALQETNHYESFIYTKNVCNMKPTPKGFTTVRAAREHIKRVIIVNVAMLSNVATIKN